jgi:hypothetical protein
MQEVRMHGAHKSAAGPRAQLAADVSVPRAGGDARVLLHSGIRVRQLCFLLQFCKNMHADRTCMLEELVTADTPSQGLQECEDEDMMTWKVGTCCMRQVVNKTMLRLNVGERAALSKGLRTLATLGPDGHFRLPVLRAETGLMCFQPAGALPAMPSVPLSTSLTWCPDACVNALRTSLTCSAC